MAMEWRTGVVWCIWFSMHALRSTENVIIILWVGGQWSDSIQLLSVHESMLQTLLFYFYRTRKKVGFTPVRGHARARDGSASPEAWKTPIPEKHPDDTHQFCKSRSTRLLFAHRAADRPLSLTNASFLFLVLSLCLEHGMREKHIGKLDIS